ncbi:MAG: hypothetical protein IK104_11845 [Clostridia bacterium]|nr:hypothetical protein [Clostridia bacterium]
MRSRLFRLFCALLALGLCLQVFSACGKEEAPLKSLTVGKELMGNSTISPDLHKTDVKRLQVVTTAGSLRLLFDPVSGGVSVYDSSADVYWHSLPVFDNKFSSIVSVTLLSEAGRYYLNSQDNAVAFGSFTHEAIDNGVRVTYVMSDAMSTALSSPDSLPPNAAVMRVPVEYRLSDGKLTVAIDRAAIGVPQGMVLDRLDLLPYFGATFTGMNDENDFLLVPDGCGGLVYPAKNVSSPFDETFSVSADANPATASVYGVGKEKASFVALVDGGGECASVRAQKSVSNSDRVNIVYPTFSLCETVFANDDCYYRDLGGEELSISFRFLSAPVCSYVDMAAACREELIRGGFLTEAKTVSDGFPLLVSVLASADGKNELTTYEQIEDLCSVLRGKGITDLTLRLYGAFDGGFGQNADSSLKPLSALGGKKAFRSMCGTLSDMNIPLYFGVDLVTTGKRDALLTLSDGSAVQVYETYPGSPYFGAGETKSVLSADALNNEALDIISSLGDHTFTGYSINALYPRTYPDAAYMSALTESFLSLRADKKLMLPGMELSLLPYADLLSDIPLTTSISEADDYEAVPFFPAVLHGVVPFAGTVVNATGAYKLELLKCVEYGAIPQVLFVFQEGSPYYYEESMSDVADFCITAKEDLGDLSGRAIESHRIVLDGLSCTGFSGGTLVYVNHNNYSVNYNNITIPPYSYIRLN